MQYANLANAPKSAAPPGQSQGSKRRRGKSSKAKKIILFGLIFLAVFAVYNFLPFILQFAKIFKASPKIVYQVVANKEPELKQSNGRTNILLLGTGGGNHDGPNLTDTIIVASVDVKTGDAVLISFPRDVYVPETASRINAIYAVAEPRETALKKTEDELSNITGLPIHYGLRVDFSAFQKMIDTVGGIDVTVEKGFDDYAYPILGKEHESCGFVEVYETVAAEASPSASPEEATASARPTRRLAYVNNATGKKIYADQVTETNNPYSCRFEHIHFEKGPMHMDGETALKYVRSRHATGGEGSDFARSRRQQLVIQAFRSALTKRETLLDVSKLQNLASTFGSTIDTDISPDKYGDFYQLYRRMKESQIRTVSLTDGADSGEAVFYNPPTSEYNGMWVLVPKGKTWTTVQEAVAKALLPPTPTPSPSASATGSARPRVRPTP